LAKRGNLSSGGLVMSISMMRLGGGSALSSMRFLPRTLAALRT
jgi:hypothetical protein